MKRISNFLKHPLIFIITICLAVGFIVKAAIPYQNPVYAATPLLIQTGIVNSGSTGSSSNNFPIAYGAGIVPTVICQPIGLTNTSGTNIVGFITNSYFILTNQAVNVSNNYIAVGSP